MSLEEQLKETTEALREFAGVLAEVSRRLFHMQGLAIDVSKTQSEAAAPKPVKAVRKSAKKDTSEVSNEQPADQPPTTTMEQLREVLQKAAAPSKEARAEAIGWIEALGFTTLADVPAKHWDELYAKAHKAVVARGE